MAAPSLAMRRAADGAADTEPHSFNPGPQMAQRTPIATRPKQDLRRSRPPGRSVSATLDATSGRCVRKLALPCNIEYKGRPLRGHYRMDFVCFGEVVVEVKSRFGTGPAEQARVLNYLAATGHHHGLLLNFGTSRLDYRRFVLTKPRCPPGPSASASSAALVMIGEQVCQYPADVSGPRRLSQKAGLHEITRALRRCAGTEEGRRPAVLLRPETPRLAPALRPETRMERRPALVGRAEGSLDRSAGQTPGDARGGSSDRLRHV